MSIESTPELRAAYFNGLVARFNLSKPLSADEREAVEAKTKAREYRKHQKDLDNWYGMVEWKHLRTWSDLAVYIAPRFIQRRLEQIIPPSKIQGYHRSKDPFRIYKD